MMPPLFSFENLYRQYLRCRRQKRNTHNALRFEAKLEDNLVRLRDAERKLVLTRSGYTLFRHDPATLTHFRATWASYRAHLNMANSYRLWETLVRRSGWVRHFFVLEGGLLVPRVAAPSLFRRLRDQSRFFADRFPDSVLLVQVGRLYEVYDEQAARVSRLLGLRLHAAGRGFQARCGVPVARGPWCARMLVARGIPVAVVRETDDRPWLGGVKPRALAGVWAPKHSVLNNAA